MNRANLIRKDGSILVVPIQSEAWPAFIDHQTVEQTGTMGDWPNLQRTEQTIRFFYIGCQYGIAAYVEATTPFDPADLRDAKLDERP